MEIKFSCVCGQRVAVDSTAEGQEFPCPCCGNTLTVPTKLGSVNLPPIYLPPRVPTREKAQPPPPVPREETLRFSQYHTAPLERLQQAGLVRKRIAQKIVWSLPENPWQTIVDDWPQLLTQEGISMSVDCEHHLRERAYVAKMDFGNVVQRSPDEKPVTEKQLEFLRSLGVEDEAFLSSLGIRHASAVIEYVLENKGNY